jgi:hypothetical protein
MYYTSSIVFHQTSCEPSTEITSAIAVVVSRAIQNKLFVDDDELWGAVTNAYSLIAAATRLGKCSGFAELSMLENFKITLGSQSNRAPRPQRHLVTQ